MNKGKKNMLTSYGKKKESSLNHKEEKRRKKERKCSELFERKKNEEK